MSRFCHNEETKSGKAGKINISVIQKQAEKGHLWQTARSALFFFVYYEALRQRITVHYNYEGLSDQEVPDYISHNLELAGGSRSILEGGALSAIHGYSEGNARKIDNLMTDPDDRSPTEPALHQYGDRYGSGKQSGADIGMIREHE